MTKYLAPEIPVAGKVQGEVGQKTDFENFCSDKVPLSFKWPQVFRSTFVSCLYPFPPLRGSLPLTGIAICWRPSSQVAAVLT